MGPEPGPIARVLGVFTKPAETFASIARKPGWDFLVPVVLVMAALFVSQMATVPKMDVDQGVKNQMKFVDKMAKGNLTEDKRAEIEKKTREGFESGKKPFRLALNTLFLFIPVLLAPAIYHGLAAAFDAKTSYFKVLNGYAYTQSILLVPILLTAVVGWQQTSIAPADIQFARVLKSNVGAFLDFETTNKAILALASSLDVFDIWAFIVGSIALSKTSRFSAGAARLVVGVVWGAYILCKVVLGAFLSSVMG
jgi:hypothetical protein